MRSGIYGSYGSSYGSYGKDRTKKKSVKKESLSKCSIDDISFGKVGLSNLGNTCFMNSSLQCLSSIRPLVEILFSEIPKKTFFTASLGRLFRGMAEASTQGRGAVTPSAVKAAAGRLNPMFLGYQQHDSHEFMVTALDAVHSELNEGEKLPYEELDADDKSTAEAHALFRENFDARNRSPVVDALFGSYIQQFTCQECKHVSTTFEFTPFLAVPVPERSPHTVKVLVLTPGGGAKADISLSKRTPGGEELYATVRGRFGLEKGSFALVAVGNGSSYSKATASIILPEETCKPEQLSRGRYYDPIIVVAVPLSGELALRDPDAVPVVLLTDGKEPSVSVVMGRNEDVVEEIVDPKVDEQPKKPLYGGYSSYYSQAPSKPKARNRMHVTLGTAFTDHGIGALEDKGYTVTVKRGTTAKTYSYSYGYGYKKPSAEETVSTRRFRGAIRLPAGSAAPSVYPALWEAATDTPDPTVEESDATLPGSLRRAIGSEASLDTYRCSKCSRSTSARHTSRVWQPPRTLIVHLKRFRGSGYHREKNTTAIEYPISGLDLSPFMHPESPFASPKYSLSSVSLHSGGMGGGHYTALARGMDGRYYDCNDSHVSSTKPKTSPSAAYVLIYSADEE
eukprot:gnl/Dysnectes_brevis/1347_a1512_1736.p1 GENE.gnl/Dysnectes_brevis/1347_a1512_1736~~gnl/Dysnectes_brevis/1347_a1512_1736.p1  ORF type:complete len:622 (-),score=210.00 gnl/Dysnectes_brevis/1347_a1512_1736:34-1899(-)